MDNYLICDNCQHKNAITSERIVFCKGCKKKISNNYLDWKKEKFNSSFENYVGGLNSINEFNKNHLLNTPVVKQKIVFKSIIHKPSKKSLIFITTSVIQLLLLVFLTYGNNDITIPNNDFNTQTSCNTESITANKSNYISEVKWTNYPINKTLSLCLPFQLNESISVLPSYMENYLTNHKSQKSESSQSFSVTIEKMNFDAFYKIKNEDIVSVNDEYMKTTGIEIIKGEALHTIIKGYKTYVQYGSYKLNGKDYLYENYTLTKGNEGVKIILSYLKHDNLLCKYADIVTQSLISKNHII